METKTITRVDLADAIVNEIGLSRKESAELLETVLNEISNTLVKGDNVKISSFGGFLVKSKNERIGRNPKTGQEVPISPRRVVSFRPSKLLKTQIND
ncbi:MAG: integration host factor subunit alpha [Alphaproteobacteria bacterium]|nr:integration host factor subunit alpha [Alphaproteobacteria bacterium]